MHELSIARSIVELVEEQADNRGASVVEELELEIGHLSGVEIQTLEFALDSAIKAYRRIGCIPFGIPYIPWFLLNTIISRKTSRHT